MKNSDYKISVSDEVHESLINYPKYIINQYQNYFAVLSIINDYHQTLERLKLVGDGIQLCDFPSAKRERIRKIRFKKHNYYLFYTIDKNTIIVLRAYHGSQQYQKYF